MAKCRSCDADIIWVITEGGKRMPVDAKPMTVCVLEEVDGQVLSKTVRGHQSHFASCPNADQHRRS